MKIHLQFSILAAFACVFLFSECSTSENPSTKKNGQQNHSTEDSLAIVHSDEYQRTAELLTWYKKGDGLFGICEVEKYDDSNPDSLLIYIDNQAVTNYLKRCRNSGFFSKNYIHNDSLYIEEAKKAYTNPKIEVYDYFDHDFILQTQETPETLKAIPNIRIVPEKCDLKKGKIVFVVAFQELEYTFVKENGFYKLDKIG
ncbi:MAG: hypothetical protein V4604_01275 [Bacteroidota bacterium]